MQINLNMRLRGALILRLKSDDEPAQLIGVLAALGRLAGCALASVVLLDEVRALACMMNSLVYLVVVNLIDVYRNSILGHVDNRVRLGLIVCDLDHLKRFNDRYGHQAGDRAIRDVGAIIRECCDELSAPAELVPCRFGGEEFAIVAANISAEFVLNLANTICERVCAVRDNHILTVSIGWGILQGNETSAEFFARIDKACYQAKAMVAIK